MTHISSLRCCCINTRSPWNFHSNSLEHNLQFITCPVFFSDLTGGGIDPCHLSFGYASVIVFHSSLDSIYINASLLFHSPFGTGSPCAERKLTFCCIVERVDVSVAECTWTLSALEALRNALYKFKTYLLTYLLIVFTSSFAVMGCLLCLLAGFVGRRWSHNW